MFLRWEYPSRQRRERTLGRGPAWAGRVLDKGHPLVASSCEREVVVDPIRGAEFVLQLPAQVYAATVKVPHVQVAVASVSCRR